MQPLEKGKEFNFFDTIRPQESIKLGIVERSALKGPISLLDWVSAPPLSAAILPLQKTYKISWNMHQKAARWPILLLIFLFISSKDQKLMKTGCANLCSNTVIDRAAQRIEKDRCSETPTFVIGFSMSQHDRHLVACRLLSHLVHQSHNWEGGDSTSQAWLFLKRKQKIHTLYFIGQLLNPLISLFVHEIQDLPWDLLQSCSKRSVVLTPEANNGEE